LTRGDYVFSLVLSIDVRCSLSTFPRLSSLAPDMAVSRFGLGAALSRPAAAASRRPALCLLARVAALLPCPAAQPCALTPGVRVRGSLRVSCSATPPALLEAALTQAAAASAEARPSAKRKLGHLHLITGPMFSGKTTELLHHVRKHEARLLGSAMMLS